MTSPAIDDRAVDVDNFLDVRVVEDFLVEVETRPH